MCTEKMEKNLQREETRNSSSFPPRSVVSDPPRLFCMPTATRCQQACVSRYRGERLVEIQWRDFEDGRDEGRRSR